ncbi:hypothetical protein DID88_000837 [Monilinia fructigena]|uniref:NADP-dependent oxidoreductase domain-containing protein n=1 Tax=Monilinia fructigena TaxID=38457 RepID=A0A395IIT1_9HELO|nr:hypothetical protein DID88_000837 [Monilinia fructigena]
MEYTRLGKSGLKISKVIFGAMSFGSSEWQDWVINEDEALPLLKHAYDLGLNTWDTADTYSNGKSEEIIGKALKQYSIPRNKVVILSKCYFGVAEDGSQPLISALSTNDGEMVNRVGLSRKHILDAVDKSVTRLGTYIDVLQIHRLDRDTPREEIMRALNDVVESGKVRYIGASSMAAWEFQTLQNIAEKKGWHKFISMQNYYNLLYREEEREMIPYCRDTGVGLIPWSPIARGALARPLNDRGTTRENSDKMLKALIRSKETIAWCLSKDSVNPIIGLSSKERIEQAVEAVKFASSGKLSAEEIAYLEEGYAPKVVQGY